MANWLDKYSDDIPKAQSGSRIKPPVYQDGGDIPERNIDVAQNGADVKVRNEMEEAVTKKDNSKVVLPREVQQEEKKKYKKVYVPPVQPMLSEDKSTPEKAKEKKEAYEKVANPSTTQLLTEGVGTLPLMYFSDPKRAVGHMLKGTPLGDQLGNFDEDLELIRTLRHRPGTKEEKKEDLKKLNQIERNYAVNAFINGGLFELGYLAPSLKISKDLLKSGSLSNLLGDTLQIYDSVKEEDYTEAGLNTLGMLTKLDNFDASNAKKLIFNPSSLPRDKKIDAVKDLINLGFAGQQQTQRVEPFQDVPVYQYGGDVPERNIGMDSMMKSKIGMGNAFNHPAIKRMSQAMPKTGMTPEGEGTHYMQSMDNYAVPLLQDLGEEELTYIENPSPGPEDIRFNSPEEAEYFAKHYKDVAPMSTIYKDVPKAQRGVVIKDERLQGVTTRDNTPTPVFNRKQERPLTPEEIKQRQRMLAEQHIAERQGEIKKHTPQSKLSKAKEVALNPLTAFGYVARNEELPDNFSKGDRVVTDYVADFANPAYYVESAKNLAENQAQVFSDLSQGNFGDAALSQTMTGVEALNFIPLTKGAKPFIKKGMQQLENIPTNITSENLISKINNITNKDNFKAINEHLSGIQEGLFSKTDKRPLFEKFPITSSQKQKVYEQQDKALEEAKKFIKDWHYGDDVDLHPDIVKKMQELDPNFNLSIYDNTNITDPANPFAATNNALSSTRRNILKNENLSDYAKEYILDNRNKIGGVNIKDTNESITLRNRGLYHYSPSSIKDTVIHEAGHTSENLGTLSYRDPNGNIVWGTKPFDNIRTYDPDLTDYYIANPNTEQGKIFQEAMVEPIYHKRDADGKITKRGYTWEASPGELHSELLPARANLIDSYVSQGHNRKEIMDMLRSNPTDEQIDWMINNQDLNRFFKKTTSPELKRKVIRMLYSGVPLSIGVGAASQMQEEVPQFQKGGIIEDNRGQWAHPGEITEINSPYITMKGVPYPVLGISDVGDTQMMYPEQEYKFVGNKVTEYPLAKNGSALKRLDDLTNFTNYNKPQSSGWLSKYE
jgi:hypothetical protein